MSSLRIIPLGGLGEVGMNCLALEQRGEALVVDCGVSFGERDFGVDVVHPDFEPLADYRLAGLFITHGHEDHVGAVPYFLRRFDVPVFGPRYALGLLRDRASEHEILRKARLQCVTPGTREAVGSFEVEPIRVTHSTADSTALAIRTDAGLVIHTGDFKFDETPPDDEPFDIGRFASLGLEGVRLLLSDSTNVDASGPTGDEDSVARTLEGIVAEASGAVVVSLFASNVHRLRVLGEIARRHRRKVVPLGRGIASHARVARSTLRATGRMAGTPYLGWGGDLVWPAERAGELPRSAVLAIATGSQGEAGAALARLASGEHPSFTLLAGDTVILSSRVIPGNEGSVAKVMAALLRRGVKLRSWWSDRSVHVSGHAHSDEQRRMIDLVRPRAFVPVHGTLHHLFRHAVLAEHAGVAETCVLENGDIGEVDDAGLRKIGRVRAGKVHVFGGRVVPSATLGERASLAAHGIVHVTVLVDSDGSLQEPPRLAARGVLDEAGDSEALAIASKAAAVGAQSAAAGSDADIAEAVRLAVRRALQRAVGFRPMTLVTVVRRPC
jgi:ribonuclease J